MRAEVERVAMPETGSVQRPAYASDGSGGRTTTWSTVDASVPVRVHTMDADEKEEAGRLGLQGSYILTVPQAQDVRPRDRLVVGSRTFDVAGILGAHSFQVDQRLAAQETTR